MGSSGDQSGRPGRPRLRERLLLWGEEQLSDAELLALVLGTGRRGEGVELLAGRLLRERGGLLGLARADVHELAAEPGLGPARAAAVAGLFALARRLGRSRPVPAPQLLSPRDVYDLVAPELRGFPQERFLVLCLDGRNRLLRLQPVSLGSARTTVVHPRDVFAPAMRAGAVAAVVVHNHPSGDPAPSREDLDLTERLRRAGELLGVEVLDHLIVGDGRYVSLAEGPGRVTAAAADDP